MKTAIKLLKKELSRMNEQIKQGEETLRWYRACLPEYQRFVDNSVRVLKEWREEREQLRAAIKVLESKVKS